MVVSFASGFDDCLAALRETPPQVSHEVLLTGLVDSDVGYEGVRVVAPAAAAPARACNLAVSAARGSYVAFLDDRHVPDPGWLTELLGAMDAEDVGAVGSKLVYADGGVEHAGIVFGEHVLPHRILPYRIHRGEAETARHVNEPRSVSAVVRTGMLASRELLLRAGGFDEGFRAALDDVDLCVRLRQAGLRVLYCPASVLRHRDGAAADEFDEFGGDASRFESKWLGSFLRDDDFFANQDGFPPEQIRLANARIACSGVPESSSPAVVWTSALLNWSGYAEEARNTVLALDEAGIEIRANALNWPEPVPLFSPEIAARLHRLATAPLPRRFVHVMQSDGGSLARSPRATRNIGRTMYEADRIPAAWVERCNQMDEVWVPSEFNVESFAASGVDREKLYRIPAGIDTRLYEPATTPLELPGVSGFTFLSVFNWLSRKGWDVLTRAYLEEFSSREPVTLLLKVTPRPRKTVADHRDELAQWAHRYLGIRNLSGAARIVFLDRVLGAHEMPRLYRAADCYVMPSRGEGWGRPYMEAMASGLPTIGTRWSGNLEFMNDDNSYLVDCDVVPITEAGVRDEAGFRGLRWAEPSVDDLRATMRRVYEDRAAAAARGERARAEILAGYNWPEVARTIISHLEQAASRARPAKPGPAASNRRPLPPVVWQSPVADTTGFADEARTVVRALDRAGVPLLLNPGTSAEEPAAQLDPLELIRLRELSSRPTPDRFLSVIHGVPRDFRRHRRAVRTFGRTMFETDGVPPQWVPRCNAMDEVWVPSDFNLATFAAAGIDESRLQKIPEGIDVAAYAPPVWPLDLPGVSGFVFLSVIRWGRRKGWDILLRAYFDGFSRKDDVTLVLKVNTPASLGATRVRAALLRFVRDELGLDPERGPRVVLVTRNLPAAEMPRLYRAADCYVMPSRGEGWGRPYMEAMASGLPTIGTRWSGNLEFMNDDNSYLVDCALGPVPAEEWPEAHRLGHRWAEPSAEHLAVLMRYVFEHRGEAQAVGERARGDITSRFGADRVAEAILARLTAAVRASD